jgi:hypothetical protein
MTLPVPLEDKLFVRVAWLNIRYNEEKRRSEVLYVRSPTGKLFFIPGGRLIEGLDEIDSLIKKIHLDLNIDLIRPTLKRCLSFRAPAFDKTEGTMVENHYYRADCHGVPMLTDEIDEIEWRPHGHGKEETEADKVALAMLKEASVI